jgi:hypothetical protein
MNDQQRAAMQEVEDYLRDCANSPVMAAKLAALREALAQPQGEHKTDGTPCWCNPEVTYENSETGAKVIVHKEPQGEPVAWVIWGEGNVPELAWDTPKPDDVANALYYTPPSVEAAIEATKEKVEKALTIDVKSVTPYRDYSAMSPLDCYEAGLLDASLAMRTEIKKAIKQIFEGDEHGKN